MRYKIEIEIVDTTNKVSAIWHAVDKIQEEFDTITLERLQINGIALMPFNGGNIIISRIN